MLQGWADYLRSAPDELTSVVDFANPFAGGPEAPVEIQVVFDGDDPELAAAGHRPDPPARHGDRRRGRADALCGHARGRRDPAAWHPASSPEAPSSTRNRCPRSCRSSPRSAASEGSPIIAVRSVGGAVSRVPDDATAYAHRQAELVFVTIIAGPEAGRRGRSARRWTRSGTARTSRQRRLRELPHLCHRGGVAAIYPPETYKRLAAVKRAVRPRQPVRPQPQRPAAAGARPPLTA